MLGMLTATLPARSHLPSRPAFVQAVATTLKKRGELEPNLLDGLE